MHSREKQKEHSTEAAIAASLVNDIITEIVKISKNNFFLHYLIKSIRI